MKKLLFIPILLVLTGCSPIEKQAYTIIVGARAFTQNYSANYPQCGSRGPNGRWVSAGNKTTPCPYLDKAIAAKDVLIDATLAYCGSADFNSGSACTPPSSKDVKKTLADKITAAIKLYETTEGDLRAAVK